MAPGIQEATAVRGNRRAISTVPVEEDSVLDEILGRLHKKYGFHTRQIKPRPTSDSSSTTALATPRPWIQKLKSLLEADQDGVDDALDLLDTAAGSVGVFGHRKTITIQQRSQLLEVFEEILDGKLAELGDRDVSLLTMMGIESASDPKSGVEATPSKNGEGCWRSRWAETPPAASHPVRVNGVARGVVAPRRKSGSRGTPGSENPSILSKGRGKGEPEDGDGGVVPLASPAAQMKLRPRGNQLEQQQQRQRQQQQQQQQQEPQAQLQQARRRRKRGQESVHQTNKERECTQAQSESKRQPLPRVAQSESNIQSELEVDDSDGSFYSAPSSPIAMEADCSFPGASASLGPVQQVSHFRVSGQKNHERRPILHDQGKQDIAGPIKPTPKKHLNPDSSEPPVSLSFGTVASSSIANSFGSSSVSIRSFTSRGPPSTAATSFNNDVSGWDVPVPRRASWVRGSSELDPFAMKISDGEEGLTDLDEPEPGRSFDKIPTPATGSGALVNNGHRPANSQPTARFPRTVLSPLEQSVQGSEASEQEVQELAQLSGFFNGPSIVEGPDSRIFGQKSTDNLDRLFLEEAEGIGAVVEEKVGEACSIGNKPKPSVPVPDDDLSDEYDDEVTKDESFDAALLVSAEYTFITSPFELIWVSGLLDSDPLVPAQHPLDTLPFQIQFEATRAALSNGAPANNRHISSHLNNYCDRLYDAGTYTEVLDILREYAPHLVLEKSAESTWNEFRGHKGWADSLYMTGRVYSNNLKPLPSDPITFGIELNPLSKSKGCRFFNRFGSDRFLTLRLPSFSSQNMSRQLLEDRLIDWLVDEEVELLNRCWRCFYLKEGKSKKRAPDEKTYISESFVQAIFFAVKGAGIGEDEGEMVRLGFRALDKKLRGEMSVEDLLRWHVPFENNGGMTIPKFWSRISLGFSDTTPSIRFEPSQIKFVDDVKSPTTGEIMNDGCSVVSPAVMKRVREILKLDETPTAVQARLGGAKGVWMVDPRVPWNSDKVFIEVTESQLKYKGYEDDDDWARLTLDVLFYSHEPAPTNVNNQLIPILEDRGVPFEALKQLLEEHLEEDLDELFRIFDRPPELRKWIFDRGAVGKGRMASNSVPCLGGRPTSNYEMSIMLLESGFEVRSCRMLMESVRKMIDEYCEVLKSKLHIRIPHSTTLLCVADPTGTLREGEVSLRFSNGFLDPKTLRRNQVIVGDILVARNPAHVPSDIQKVRAVDIAEYHSPALRELNNVIVFSVKGDRSLASLLSGGDYDGDKPWVCWEERLVEPFENSPTSFDEVDDEVKPWFDKSGERVIDLDPREEGFFGRFLRAGLRSSLQESFLGQCTSIWEKYCYEKGCISDAGAIRLAKLCSLLVDAPKQGMSLLPEKVREMKKYGGGPTPAYKEGKSRGRTGWTHIIDRLHFEVADPKVMEKQTAFHKDVGGSERYCDGDLSAIYWRERNRAQKGGQKSPLSRTLFRLSQELTSLKSDWTKWLASRQGGSDDHKAGVSHFFHRYREIKPYVTEDHAVISRWVSDGGDIYSEWSMLRASTAYFNWGGDLALVWYMAGKELCYIKCHAVGLRETGLGPRTMTDGMYVPLVTSKKFMSGRPTGISRTDEVEFYGQDDV